MSELLAPDVAGAPNASRAVRKPSSWLAYNSGIVPAGQVLVEVRAGKRLTSVKKV
jgi:hypothetical protein